MAAQGININTSGAASTRLDMEARGLELVNRLGIHYYNSEEETDRFFEAIGRRL
jgi:selenocysteine lyase/cysteine desulfurase